MTKGMIRGKRMVIMTELRTCEVILMMTLAVIRGKNERSTNLVMKKAMRQALMTALLIVIMILKMKNS